MMMIHDFDDSWNVDDNWDNDDDDDDDESNSVVGIVT